MQLPLGFGFDDTATFDSFFTRDSAEVVKSLRACATGAGESFLYVWGGPGLGKSHLLQAACRAASDAGRSVMFIPLSLHRQFDTAVLHDIEQADLVCLDDLCSIAGQPAWEEALFGLLNRTHERGCAMIVAAAAPPATAGINLPDLVSRLSRAVVYRLTDLEDGDKLEALQQRALGRGLELPKDVGHFLLRRFPRDMPSLFDLLGRLDRASLAAQRKLTIPFVRDVLGDL